MHSLVAKRLNPGRVTRTQPLKALRPKKNLLAVRVYVNTRRMKKVWAKLGCRMWSRYKPTLPPATPRQADVKVTTGAATCKSCRLLSLLCRIILSHEGYVKEHNRHFWTQPVFGGILKSHRGWFCNAILLQESNSQVKENLLWLRKGKETWGCSPTGNFDLIFYSSFC